MKEKIATKSYDMTTGIYLIAFTNGFNLTTDVTKLFASDEEYHKFVKENETAATAMFHGIGQKEGDSFAGEKDIKEAIAKCTKVRDAIESKQWKLARSNEGNTKALTELENGTALATAKMFTMLYPAGKCDIAEATKELREKLSIPERIIPKVMDILEAEGHFKAEHFTSSGNETIDRLRSEATQQ